MMPAAGMRPFMVMDIVREAARHPDAVHFEIGQPDLPPSPAVQAALQQAIADNRFGYTESLGLPALREAISRHYQHEYGVTVDPARILLTPGTSGAFLIAYALTLPAGSRLGLTDPCYPCYRNFAHLFQVQPQFFPVSAEDHYQLHPDQLAGSRLAALQISSPANPTGNVYTPERLQALNEACLAAGTAFISDELYHGLVYEGRAATALEFNPDAYVINGFSKYFCLPGARLGWIIVPKDRVRDAEVVAQNLFICAPSLSQYGALAAFDPQHLATVRQTFWQRRDFLYRALAPVFDLAAKPQGAFYLWADVSRYSHDSHAFARRLLAETGVACAPGIDFGRHGTAHHVRFAYTRNIEHMQQGVDRIRAWLGG